jgi:hypothetical protein
MTFETFWQRSAYFALGEILGEHVPKPPPVMASKKRNKICSKAEK